MTRRAQRTFLGLILFVGFVALAVQAQPARLISALDGSHRPAAGGGGDSYGPVLSPDGRFVLFASSANNLVTVSSNRPLPTVIPAPLNVYLRDRTNGTTTLVSISMGGDGGGNDDSVPISVSENGRYVLFESSASNL